MSVPCPFCGAHAETRETRTQKSGVVTRTKVCMQSHKFNTQEMVYAPRFGRLRTSPTAKPKHMLTQLARRESIRIALLSKDGRSARQIAIDTDASARTVSRIRVGLIERGLL